MKGSWDEPHVEEGGEHFEYLSALYENFTEEDYVPSDSDEAVCAETGHGLTRCGSDKACYGEKISPEKGDEIMEGDNGLVYYAILVSDEYCDPKHCTEDGSLKSRRPMPHVRTRDFFASLAKTEEGKWVFNGVLNGWPALTTLELLKMEYVYKEKGIMLSKVYWESGEGGSSESPYFPEAGLAFFLKKPTSVRITLRKPAWSSVGYSEESRGFFFWFVLRPDGPKVAHGENTVSAIEEDRLDAKAVRAHVITHRYAKEDGESVKDKLTYHAAVLVEWDHGKHCTFFELAWLNALGGYGGKCNWCEDKEADRPELYDALPACMKAPWSVDMGEIRAVDVRMKTLDEVKAFLKKHEGNRFLSPLVAESGDICISFNSQRDIARCLVNYSYRETHYSEAMRNCQTFAADFFGFLCAKDTEPFHAVNQAFYFRKRDHFLYKPDMLKRENDSILGIRSLKELKEKLQSM